ncbi:hypothetical protein KFU94_67760 [Chloroflexi bacterium TSY]|nr:hypothetical protein [Chloroflexi bacterium TSY]
MSRNNQARFHIDEILRGEDVTVVGKTSMVTGEITINPANLAQTEIGPIQVDARDLATDSRRRNTIRRFILGS